MTRRVPVVACTVALELARILARIVGRQSGRASIDNENMEASPFILAWTKPAITAQDRAILKLTVSSLEDGGLARRRQVLVDLLRLGGVSGAATGLAVWLRSLSRRPQEDRAAEVRRDLRVPPDPAWPDLAVATGDDPRTLVRRAVHALGGAGRFVARGDVVLVKPNMAWDRMPAQAANTNPAVIAETVRLMLEAGARRVIVTDVSINEPRRCFERSGIAEAARAAGATIVLPGEGGFRDVRLRGEVLDAWPVFQPFLEADKVINAPVAKHHSLTGASLGIKNWYGILGGERRQLHQHIHESLADLASFMRPTLTILDAWRVLKRNGPSGGDQSDVELRRTVLAGTDPVAVDAWAAQSCFNLDENTLRYLALAASRGLGTTRFESLRIAAV